MNKKNAVLAILFVLFALFLLKGRGTPSAKRKGGATATTTASTLADKGGRMPELTKVEIVPSSPNLGDVLKVQLLAEGPSSEAVTYRYRWLVNQNEVSNEPILPLKDYRQGDTVSVEVTLSNGEASPISRQSAPVKIGNNPPIVKSVKISPAEPKANQEIEAVVEAVDPDGDPVSYSYKWQVNAQSVEDESGSVLEGKYVHSADQISVTVTPRDSFTDGTPLTSQPILVTNEPPEINSLPPSAAQDDVYSYQIDAKDPDGDSLKYQLIEGPDGMSLDPASGLLIWKVASASDDKANVKVQVDDGKGGKSIQQFSIKPQ
jgi:hypothetical protein